MIKPQAIHIQYIDIILIKRINTIVSFSLTVDFSALDEHLIAHLMGKCKARARLMLCLQGADHDVHKLSSRV